ncbi:MAG: hypothetical protein GDA44_13040 [Prochloron sp. SP5CPC1]|nr:hypothetical protein [Candidatus Paraprochloron terpiosi SP5CPC1]
MSEEFRQILSISPPAAEILASHKLAFEFHREVEYRQELAKMRGDLNIFRWFQGHRGRD